MTIYLSVYQLKGDYASPHSKTALTCSAEDALKAAEIMREHLPPGFLVGLCDEQGRNIKSAGAR